MENLNTFIDVSKKVVNEEDMKNIFYLSIIDLKHATAVRFSETGNELKSISWAAFTEKGEQTSVCLKGVDKSTILHNEVAGKVGEELIKTPFCLYLGSIFTIFGDVVSLTKDGVGFQSQLNENLETYTLILDYPNSVKIFRFPSEVTAKHALDIILPNDFIEQTVDDYVFYAENQQKTKRIAIKKCYSCFEPI